MAVQVTGFYFHFNVNITSKVMDRGLRPRRHKGSAVIKKVKYRKGIGSAVVKV